MASSLFDLVVLDLDGTVLDSLQDLADSANELVAAYGGRPLGADQVARMVGEGVGLLVERVVAATGISMAHGDAVARFLEIYDSRLTRCTRPYPGIEAVVRDASQRMPLAVLTNKPAAAAVKALAGLGLAPYFREIAGGDGVDPRKPAPEGLQRIMAGAGAPPGRTLLVGDSVIDLRTARNAQTKFCYARYGFGRLQFPAGELSAGDFIIDSAGELAAVLDGSRPPGGGRIRSAS